MNHKNVVWTVFLVLAALLISGCAGVAQAPASAPQAQDAVSEDLAPASLEQGEKLHVVATTSIVADVVSNVGGEQIDLVGLMPIGADPHSFTATPQDMRSLNDANVIFINGLDLEESLMPVLENLDNPIPMVSVSEGIETMQFGVQDEHADEEHADEEHSEEEHAADDEHAEDEHADEEHTHAGADPHAWFSVDNVKVWVHNIEQTLSELDSDNAAAYAANAEAYLAQLDELNAEIDAQVATIPEANRKIVTDHIALGYFARDYGFETIGSVLPSFSTLAAASAQELASLQQAMADNDVKALFVSTSVNPQTATQIANDLGIPVVTVYTGSLSDADGPASTYIDLMRYDVSQIVDALK